MPNTITPAAVALYCDQCEQPATQEIDWVELTDTLDERGNTTTVCDSHICWMAAIEVIEDEFAGKVQQTRYIAAATVTHHRRNHDIPAHTSQGGGAYIRGGGMVLSGPSELVACVDCHQWIDARSLGDRCLVNYNRLFPPFNVLAS